MAIMKSPAFAGSVNVKQGYVVEKRAFAKKSNKATVSRKSFMQVVDKQISANNRLPSFPKADGKGAIKPSAIAS